MSVDVTFFEFTPFFSSCGQCMSHDLISSHEGEVSFPSPTFLVPLSSPLSSPPPKPLAS